MGAAPICGGVPLWSRMWGAHTGIPECIMEPLLHALVPDDFVQFRISTGFDVSICTINGLAGKKGSTQDCEVGSTVAAFDAVNHHIVAMPYRVFDCRPNLAPLLGSFPAVGRFKSHALSSGEGHPPTALRAMREAAHLHGRFGEAVNRMGHWDEACQKDLPPLESTRRSAPERDLCPLPKAPSGHPKLHHCSGGWGHWPPVRQL